MLYSVCIPLCTTQAVHSPLAGSVTVNGKCTYTNRREYTKKTPQIASKKMPRNCNCFPKCNDICGGHAKYPQRKLRYWSRKKTSLKHNFYLILIQHWFHGLSHIGWEAITWMKDDKFFHQMLISLEKMHLETTAQYLLFLLNWMLSNYDKICLQQRFSPLRHYPI